MRVTIKTIYTCGICGATHDMLHRAQACCAPPQLELVGLSILGGFVSATFEAVCGDSRKRTLHLGGPERASDPAVEGFTDGDAQALRRLDANWYLPRDVDCGEALVFPGGYHLRLFLSPGFVLSAVLMQEGNQAPAIVVGGGAYLPVLPDLGDALASVSNTTFTWCKET